jgi:hypothetical protein
MAASTPEPDMRKPLPRSVLPVPIAALLAGACALAPAHADIYTWTDDRGRVNISNLEPPEGARVTSVLRESKATKEASEAARESAREREKEALRDAEVRALAERVRQLQAEVELAKRPAPAAVAQAPQYVPYTGAHSGEWAAPPVQYNVINASPVMDGGAGSVGGGCYSGWPECQFGWYPGSYPAYYPVNVVLPRDRHFRRDPFPRPTPHVRGPVAPWSPILVPGSGRGR